MEQKQRTRMLVEAGLSIAIAYVLHFVVLFQMPQGGSVNAAIWYRLLFLPFVGVVNGASLPVWLTA